MNIDFTYRPGEGLPQTALRQIRDAGAVFWSDSLGAWAVTSYDAVQEVLTDLTRFTSAGTPVEETLGREGMLLNDTSLHNKMRAVWTKAMSRGSIAARSDELERIAGEELAQVQGKLEAGEAVDLIPVIQRYTMRFVSSIFDIPEEKLDVIQRWNQMSSDAPVLELAEEEAERHLAAKRSVYDMVAETLADRRQRLARGEEPEDLVTLMAAAEGRDGITPAMVSDNLFNIIIGSDTTERWIGNAIIRLASDSRLRLRLLTEPAFLEPVLQEVMRIDTVAQVIMRRVKADDVRLCGQALKTGDQLLLFLGAANGDPVAFKNGDAFEIDRAAKQNLGFGYGFHNCLGINIARQEAIGFVCTLLKLLPDFGISDCDYGDTWALWGPRRLEIVSG